MRSAFGLVALLVSVAILIYIWSMYTGEVSTAYKKTQPKVEQMTGRGDDNRPAIESVTLVAAQSPSGRFTGMQVTAIAPGGAMEKYFALQVGDIITEAVVQGANMSFEGSDRDAKAFITNAYQTQGQLIVLRGAQKLTLPRDAASAAPRRGTSELQQQLDAVPRVP